MIYERFTASVSGSVIRRITCEKCSCTYAYELTRSGRGAGISPYMLDSAGAEFRARSRANKRLRRALERDVEPVECPECGWYQAEMQREARRRALQPIVPLALVCLALAAGIALVAGMFWATSPQGFEEGTWRGVAKWVGGLTGIALLGLIIRWVVRQRSDLNRSFPARPVGYPGAPLGYKVDPAGIPREASISPARAASASTAVGAYPAPPPRSLKASTKPRPPRRID
jgi:hypothetical protein